MSGMNSGLNIDNPFVVAAFRSDLIHQFLIALLLFALLGLAWIAIRPWLPGAASHATSPEPAGRKLLRLGFGILWLADGVLQAQPKMVVGLPSQVIAPTAASSPAWVRHLVNWAGTGWSYHPTQAAEAAVWIQVGIGIWLLAAARGRPSRLAGLTSAGWGLVVWVFGESFGGIFAPSLTWLFGAPGAALVYVAAGSLIALPDRAWSAASLRRLMLRCFGVFLIGMAILQAWPGRGFWQGHAGTLTGMVTSMAGTQQPAFIATSVKGFASVVTAHGFAVNLTAVLVLGFVGAAFLSGNPRLARIALAVFTVVSLADWVLIEDFGFFGGLGTDPNSMIPMILLAWTGYLALTRAPQVQPATVPAPTPTRHWLGRVSLDSVASAGAIGLILLGAVPMAAAQANPVADTVLAQAVGGGTTLVNYPAPTINLTDQRGQPVSLRQLRGKVVLLAFLDPVCTTDCPLIAQEFRAAGQLLAAQRHHVELVAVDYNPLYTQLGYIKAFDRQEHLASVPNWLFLTGSRAKLAVIWRSYGLPVRILPAGSMIAHGDYAFVIDQHGQVRRELGDNPGPGTSATKSSFAAELAGAAREYLAKP